MYDAEFSERFGVTDDEGITPITPFHKRIHYTVFEFEEFMDSSNMSLKDQITIAIKIKENYLKYDGFIVVHGTDTLAYTASTLSFVLENLNKPVIVTGSQIPILELKNDATDNLMGSLMIASQYSIPEVMVFFANKLIRGNRARKVSTN